MKLAFSSNAFKRFSLKDTIKIISKIGYDGIEIMCDVPHLWPWDATPQKISSIKTLLAKNHLGISNLNAFTMCKIGDFHHPSWIEKDTIYRKKRIRHTIASLKLATLLGAKTVSTEPGGYIPTHFSRKKALDIFRNGIIKSVGAARNNNVKLLVEPEPELLIERACEFLDFINSINSELVGLNFDIGHFYCVGESIPQTILKLARYICHFHLEDIANTRRHIHLVPGDGAIDFEAVFEAIKGIGYNGWITIELYPYQENPAEVAKRTFDFIKRYV